MFVDGRDNPLSVAPRLATEVSPPRAVNDLFLDQQASRIAIDRQLEEPEQIAKKNGAAVTFGQPFPVTIARLKRWIGTLNERGLFLHPPRLLSEGSRTASGRSDGPRRDT
jgi:polysaccharide deacetylase 2 family uncharacterized protein YibQ